MAEPQLVDYIKKARQAGQSDDQSRAMLQKNGWTEAEVADAFLTANQPKPQPQPQQQPQPQPQKQPQPQVQQQPQTQPQAQKQTQPQVQQQPRPQIQPQPTQNNMQRPRTKSHLVPKLLIVLIILILLGGAGFAFALYSRVLDPIWNPFRPSPEKVLQDMMANMKTVKTYHTLLQGDIRAADNNNKNTTIGDFSFNTSGDNDITDTKNPKASFTFTVNLSLPAPAPSPASAKIELVFIGSTAYIKVDSIQFASEYANNFNSAQILEKWFKVDQDSIKALSEAGGAETAQVNISQQSQLELGKKIQDLVWAENMFSVDKQLGDEVISGQAAYHYLIKISKEKMKDLAGKIIDLVLKESASLPASGTTDAASGASASLFAQNMVKSFADSFVDTIGDINMEMWIGKKDYMLYGYHLEKSIDVNKFYPGADTSVALKFNMTNSDFNKPASIQEPADTQRIETVLLPIIKEQKVESDLGELDFTAQSLFYASQSYYSLCRGGLLNGYLATYGKTLINLNNDIISQGAKKPVCFSGVQDYCISTQLADGSWLCVDKNGILGKTKCVSFKTVCQ